ncbi:MAG: asparagine synthase (glutamine-hydrolyzing) [Clostridia bacterium]|nr:asparagine synthase (glutamine-hydrolyzing) [Clostridia bacterium]
MCGIAGEINFKESLSANREIYRAMTDVLSRRGPDDSGIYLNEHCALCHRRLAVIDLEKGKQPMVYAAGERAYALVYNGELYNTEEIREKLLDLGFVFDGHSDTEVLLKAYVAWGANCVTRLNGIFAFAVYDAAENRLFVARDRIGVKPFFYALKSGSFLFASEIKSLLQHKKIQPEIETEAIAEIMLIGPGRTPENGVFKDICELPPACCGYFDRDGLKIKKYWHLTDTPHTDSFPETVEKVRGLVTDAIERQLVSDVPIGTFLSGGLDSSIISSVAARYMRNQGKKLMTFSLDYRDNDKYFQKSKFQPNADAEYIQKMNAYLQVENHLVVLDSEDVANALYAATEARDLPGMVDVDSSLLLFCKEIKKHCTVALSGECADEIFGGYPWYRDKEIRMRYGFPWAQSTDYRYSFLTDALAERIDPHEYVNARYQRTIQDTHKAEGLNETESRMKEMMRLNLDWFMQTLLDRKDRMSMYNGLEVRVPFCDYRIAEYLYRVPWEYKDYKGYEKGLLREAVRDLLPDDVLWRKKSPYPKTHHPIYRQTVSKMLEEVISNSNSPVLQIAKKESLEELLRTDRQTPWYGQLMTTPQTIAYFVQLNHWLQHYHVRIL